MRVLRSYSPSCLVCNSCNSFVCICKWKIWTKSRPHQKSIVDVCFILNWSKFDGAKNECEMWKMTNLNKFMHTQKRNFLFLEKEEPKKKTDQIHETTKFKISFEHYILFIVSSNWNHRFANIYIDKLVLFRCRAICCAIIFYRTRTVDTDHMHRVVLRPHQPCHCLHYIDPFLKCINQPNNTPKKKFN